MGLTYLQVNKRMTHGYLTLLHSIHLLNYSCQFLCCPWNPESIFQYVSKCLKSKKHPKLLANTNQYPRRPTCCRLPTHPHTKWKPPPHNICKSLIGESGHRSQAFLHAKPTLYHPSKVVDQIGCTSFRIFPLHLAWMHEKKAKSSP